jgi:hypothetical protein
LECAAVSQRRREAGQQNEQFRGIAQAKVSESDLRQLVSRHMVDENADEGEAAEEVDPEIAG